MLRMVIELLVLAYVIYLVIDGQNRVRKLEQLIAILGPQSNKNEININRLYYFRSIESHVADENLSMEDRDLLKEDCLRLNEELSEFNRNTFGSQK